MVVGNRGLGAFRRRLPGSVSAAVIENARCPVGIVRSAPVTDAGSMGEPVLVGVGGTRRCRPAVLLAFEEASRREVELIALHAWSDTRGSLDPFAPDCTRILPTQGEADVRCFDRWRRGRDGRRQRRFIGAPSGPARRSWRRCRHLRLPGRWTQPSRTWPEDPAFGDLRPSPAPLGSRDAESESTKPTAPAES
ncbi:universal stress protein [Nocardia beijingensis]|uniref:universal stress protein n=1 Tax=Nocardia beijingensis TaxID=95162 RepID=UPI0033B87112